MVVAPSIPISVSVMSTAVRTAVSKVSSGERHGSLKGRVKKLSRSSGNESLKRPDDRD
jgi:hypothetical protein